MRAGRPAPFFVSETPDQDPGAEASDSPRATPDAEAHPFAGLPAPLRAAIEARGFASLTPVQQAVLEASTRGENLRISSQTGSGKTLALGMALAPDLIEAAADRKAQRAGPRALLIAPTRELAQQVGRELGWLFGEVKGLHVAVVTGGADLGRERRVLARKPLVLVGTPGRLLDHITARALDLSEIRHVVLDEADQMLDMGFKDELDAIVESLPAERHSHLVSATFPREVRRFAEGFAPEAVAIEGTQLGAANADISHTVYLVRERDRYGALVNCLLMTHGERCLIFVKRRADAADVAERLSGDGFGALPFSGDLSQAQRNRTLAAFRRGVVQILVATDVAARGIDVPDIAVVVHGDIPYDTEVYTHRSGRTGRAGQSGRSILLAPGRAERRIRRLLRDAKVDAEFGNVPSIAKIKKSLTKRTRRRVHAAMEETAPDPKNVEYAQTLLERHEPAELIARLLELNEGTLPCEPHEVEMAGGWGSRKEGRDDRGRDDRGRDRDDRRGPRRGPEDYRAYSINWGFKKGATPARLLAHLCRRGGVDRQSIGAMDVGPRDSRFQIVNADAEAFWARAREVDDRDPELKIQPFDGEVRSPSSDRGSDRGPGRGPRRGPGGPRGGKGGGFRKGGGFGRNDGRRDDRRDDRRDGKRDEGYDRPRRRGPTRRNK